MLVKTFFEVSFWKCFEQENPKLGEHSSVEDATTTMELYKAKKQTFEEFHRSGEFHVYFW